MTGQLLVRRKNSFAKSVTT